VSPGRVTSIAWLGWRFVVVQPLRRLSHLAPARARFADAYFGEGLVPTRSEDREVALAAAACTGCGLCEPRCALRAAAPAVGALGLQAVFRLHTRHLGELPAAVALLEACAGCEGCDDACPSGVPIARIVAHLRAIASDRGVGGQA
jgi:Fe-S oxidoreductase